MELDRFDELLDRYKQGDATPAELAEFEQHLRTNKENRQRLVYQSLLDVQLHKVFSDILPPMQGSVRPVARSRRLQIWLTAASLLFVAVGAYFLFRSTSMPHSPQAEVAAGQIQIDGMPANRIPSGSRFEVVGDVPATICLTDGSRAEFNPQSKVAIRDKGGDNRQVVELTQGGGRFVVVHGDGKFRVETPAGIVTALGTEFTVNLQPRRKQKNASPGGPALAVAVTSGTVQVETAGRMDVLNAGSSRIFGDDGQHNQNDDGQKNQSDDGQKNNNGKNQNGKNQGNQPNGQNGNRDN